MRKINLLGQKFGRLTVVMDSGKRAKDGKIIWGCLCTCKKTTEVEGSNLVRGLTSSCGCLQKEQVAERMRKMSVEQKGTMSPRYKHGEAGTKLYRVWGGMKTRCYNPMSCNYKYYGKKGIAVCDSWRGDYKIFRGWAYDSGYNNGLCIDRIDPESNYQPSNCQWITRAENALKAWRQQKERRI